MLTRRSRCGLVFDRYKDLEKRTLKLLGEGADVTNEQAQQLSTVETVYSSPNLSRACSSRTLALALVQVSNVLMQLRKIVLHPCPLEVHSTRALDPLNPLFLCCALSHVESFTSFPTKCRREVSFPKELRKRCGLVSDVWKGHGPSWSLLATVMSRGEHCSTVSKPKHTTHTGSRFESCSIQGCLHTIFFCVMAASR